MSERRLILVRHGVTDWNREGRFQGRADPPLAEEGREEAALVAGRLADESTRRPARVVSSSLARAYATAEVVGAAVGIRVESDDRLVEVGQGEWEGRTHDELAVNDAERYAAWRVDGGRRPPPRGEQPEAVLQRIDASVGELMAGSGPWPVCLVSHGGTLRLLARRLLGLSASRAWALDLDNASVSVLVKTDSGSWAVERWNDARHLLGRVSIHVDEADGRPLAL